MRPVRLLTSVIRQIYRLLNESREKLEEIIDVLHRPLRGKKKKCRTYRQRARYEYLKIAKKRKVKAKEIRKGIRKQLGYVKRDVGHIVELLEESSLGECCFRLGISGPAELGSVS